MQRCVCASTRPGLTVELDRSITRAPAGIARPAPIAVIFPSSTRITWFAADVPRSGSTTFPARIAVTCAAPGAPPTPNHSAIRNPRIQRRLGIPILQWLFELLLVPDQLSLGRSAGRAGTSRPVAVRVGKGTAAGLTEQPAPRSGLVGRAGRGPASRHGRGSGAGGVLGG